ncbi:DUF3631 domain-containing protein [Mycolicibacterium hippocampi]|nr:DUF3631 domain-containing protein [Mycolicibacterium hippocampi]
MPEPDGAELLDDIDGFLSRFVVYPGECERRAHTLWIGHTHLMDCWESTPRIAFLSPEPGSGKSRALEVTEPLVPRPVHAVNTTSAYLFRKVSDDGGLPTILYYEIDTVFGPKAKENEDIRGLLNAGHRKGAVAGRCVVRGKIIETEELPAYCAVALAGLDDMPDTLMTRSVIVRMQRRAPGEKVEPWRLRVNGPEAETLRQRLEAWSATVAPRAVGSWPTMPAGIQDRPADVWEALLAVGDLAGGHWPDTARRSAVALVAASMRKAPTIGVLLLKDLLTIFKKHEQPYIGSGSVLTELNEVEESPWASFKKNGDPIDARALARHLRRYGIESHDQRIGDGKVQKVYFRAEFEQAWARYLPDDEPGDEQPLGDPPHESATSATAATLQVTAHAPLVTGPGRCTECGFHTETQGHHDRCQAGAA